ncbi:MAG: FAD-binding oxidoreductase [Patescibacteria group bacterium]
MLSDLKEQLLKFFKGEIEDDEETLTKYSRDASIFEVRPRLVLFPKDSEDIKNLVKFVSLHKNKYHDTELNKDWKNLSITARCAGTDMSGGAIGESLILDFTRHMNKLVKFEGDEITVQPGMFYRDFEKITLEKDLILPCYTASKSLNAMGGMFGNNSAGEKTLKYGQTEKYVTKSKVIFSDGNEYTIRSLSQDELSKKIREKNLEGEIYGNIYELINKNKDEIKKAKPNVHKNSAGYYIWNVVGESHFDLNKLLVGSQATLCIATEITFKLVPNPKYSKLVAIFMKDVASLGSLVDEILLTNPETLETYDDKTMRLAVRFFPDFLKNRGFLESIKFLWSFLPELKMMITGGFPKLILLAEFAGENEKDADKQCQKLKERLKNFKVKVHVTKGESESEKYWSVRRESFSLLRKHAKGLRTAPFIDDIIVRPEFLPKFLPELDRTLSKYKLVYTMAGHAGDGNFHIIPLIDSKKQKIAQIVSDLSEEVYDLVHRYHGSITAEHNDGLIRTPYLKKMYDHQMLGIFRQIKNIFDPQGIFNPGKKVEGTDGSGTKEYMLSHIAF